MTEFLKEDLSPEEEDPKMWEALKALEVVLREHYADNTLKVGVRLRDVEAYTKSERFCLLDYFSSETLLDKVDAVLKPRGYYLEWVNPCIFWLYSL